MSINTAYNFRQVSERVSTSGTVSVSALNTLAAEGYQVVINLLPDDNDRAVPDEQALVEAQGLQYVYIAVDFARPTLADFEQFAEAMDAARDKKVHIHCAANYRVSVFYGLYAVNRRDWTAAQAEAFISDVWQPQNYPGWPEFIQQVRASDYCLY